MKWKILSVSALMGLALAGAAQARMMSVQVQTSQVRATPSYLGQVLATVRYADQVEVVKEQGPWVQVRAGTTSGWLNASALSRDKIILKAGAEDVRRTATGEEIALAGKGFNSQVEADFKAKNRNVDFTWIDKMETYKVEETDLLKFLKEGDLR